jgi:23S rRNA (adenine2503-C2)-methyltransferase
MPTSIATSLFDLSFSELEAVLHADGVNPIHAKKLWSSIYRDALSDFSHWEFFLPPLKKWCQQNIGKEKKYYITELEEISSIHSHDGFTKKFLLRLDDANNIETVLMKYNSRFTACISTQVGCAMGCVFCATGQMGFTRHLRTSEIIAQVLHVQKILVTEHGEKLRNIVLMGMGESLHNYDSVMKALASITNSRGLNIAPSKIAISTVGLVPAIKRLANENSPYCLAVSLHGSNQIDRSKLVPIAKKWPIHDLIEACRYYTNQTSKRIFFEWTLIAGANDSPEIAKELAELLRGIDSHINLIPLNPTNGFEGETTNLKAASQFQKILRAAGYPVTIRQRRGIDVAAGCGQLCAEKLN